MKLDVLVFAAHPDDSELSMGGTIAKITNEGYKVGLIDLTEAELSTRGTIESRKEETKTASEILNVTVRENLGFPDGKLEPKDEMVDRVVEAIRKYEPQLLFAPFFNDRHPDHEGSSRIVKKAHFLSGLPKYETANSKVKKVIRAKKLYYYMQNFQFKPTFIIDITDTMKQKLESVWAFKSQFHNPDSDEPETFISDEKFVKFLEARSRLYGFKIGREFGEPFYCEEEVEMDLCSLLKKEK